MSESNWRRYSQPDRPLVIKKKIQYSLLNNIDKEDKTSAYLQAKSMELESALIKALSQSTPNRYKII
jgi:hypothetical protein